mmetsp:Transcript_3087/g.11848  ORF Transcript_3087/g.11848 Transcript_3087/m.11848 type:complete len:138 (-) Transcript_3087:23-436(-)
MHRTLSQMWTNLKEPHMCRADTEHNKHIYSKMPSTHSQSESKKLSKEQVRQKIAQYRQEIKDLKDKHSFLKDFLYEDVMDVKDRSRLRVLSEKIHSLREYGDEHEMSRRAGEKGGITRKIHALENELTELKKERARE